MRGQAGTWARGQGEQANLTQRETGDRMMGWGIHFQVSGLGSRVPGTGLRVRVQVQDLHSTRCPHLHLTIRT